MDRQAQQVGLELEERIGPRHAAIDANIGQGSSEVGVHGVDQVGDLKRDTFERGSGKVGDRRRPGQSEDCPSSGGVPVRCAESGQSRHEEHVHRRVGAKGQLVDLGRGADRPETVAKPLHGRARDEHAPLQGILGRTTIGRGGQRRE